MGAKIDFNCDIGESFGSYKLGYADTLCLHGDTPDAVEMAAALNSGLKSAGVEILPLDSLLSVPGPV